MAMTDKQKAALKKAQEAAKLKRLGESFQNVEAKSETVPIPKQESKLEEKIDRLIEAVVDLKRAVELVASNQPTKLDLSFLRK